MFTKIESQICTHWRVLLTRRRRSPFFASIDVQDLQNGALGDENVNVCVLQDDATDAELTEMGEGGAAG
jgi:hypothetical protein